MDYHERRNSPAKTHIADRSAVGWANGLICTKHFWIFWDQVMYISSPQKT